jgi:hypothetical protein
MENNVDYSTAWTGVLNTNNCRNLVEEIYDSDTINLSLEERLQYCKKEHGLSEDYDLQADPLNVLEEYEYDRLCEDSGEDTLIIGFKYNPETKLFEEDPEAEYSAVIREFTTQVVQSKYVTYCNKCSPCYPFQGDLESPGSILTFTLPPDLWGKDKPAWMKIISLKEPVDNVTGLLYDHGLSMGITMM